MVMLFDLYNLPEDIYEVIFATEQQVLVGKLLIEELKENSGEIDKTTMSLFATKLHDGKIIVRVDDPPFRGKEIKISYNKRQFYDRILTPMKGMGLIEYDMYKKTYKLSDKFNKSMTKVGIMWMTELRRPAHMHFIKKQDNNTSNMPKYIPPKS